jgi:pimeloyl-ACP methyl ester carboxylesterase
MLGKSGSRGRSGEAMKLRLFPTLLLIAYPLYAAVMFAAQAQILFPAASSTHHPLSVQLPATGTLVEIPASFGRIRAFYQPARTRAKTAPAIVYTHGNFECMEESFALVHPLAEAGIGVLQLEFPGFCGADGEASFSAIAEAGNLAYDWLARRPEVDASRIVAMGYSVGGGAAGELTRHRPVRALILLSTYTSIVDMAHRYLLPGFLVRYPYDNLRRVREFAGPVFLEHGRRDPVIPFDMGEQLARSRPENEFAALDCGHDDCHFDRSLFASRIPAWLAATGLLVVAN